MEDVSAGERIRRWRLHRAWRLQDLATKAEIDLTTLSRIERSLRPLRMDHLSRICRALEISEAEFFAITPAGPAAA